MLRANRPILAFFDAIKALRVRQLSMILKAGYDPNLMINARGQNGLQYMINYFGATDAHYRLQSPINKSAYLSIAKLLLDSGLDPNAMDLLADETVIFDAIRYNDREMVVLLLNYVDLSLRNKAGETALMCAARFGSKQVTRILLEHLRHLEMDGYFLRQRNRFGLTPLEIARSENLEAAKVITKHLISYGQHTGVVLARSVSHHQLDPRRGAPFRPSPPAAAVMAAAHHRAHRELLHADDYISPSDYDSDVPLLGAGGPRPLVRRQVPPVQQPPQGPAALEHSSRRPAYNYQAYYDPKAAEFSQYLLEQQQADQMESAGLRTGGGGHRRAAMSDDDNEDEYCGGVGRSGALVRSRSCMLGPGGSSSGAGTGAGGQLGPKSGSKKHQEQSGAGSSKMPPSWQDQSSVGADGQ